ncbi:NH(3)-dependent NAD(+) synthetase [Spiroplasma sp. TIUS-1]|uniref:NAD(+) synthase n=1 Tax=Spiroplasma sp. TIUS-1 TaxID=216963 RepID=UPI00139729FA|nr:NAD(+) synthase [Spiroplasma sp. TIUS-1]QHX35860.1 NH(3)-dependent NAD(+) synthetase [Spiroplasma sp. TIUS-1]
MDLKQYIDYIGTWLQEQVKLANAKGVIVGLSGGIDSALVASIAQKAFPNNHQTVWMDCESSKFDYECAHELINFKKFHNVDVDLTSTYKDLISELDSKIKLSDLSKANAKARLRMTTLYAIGQTKNYLVLGTDNADEWHIGYFTKFGDGGVDLLPIVHLLKGEVKDAARLMEVCDSIINRAPSAGLWDNQTDEEEIGVSYDEIDDYLSGKKISEKSKQRIDYLHKISNHKRVGAPAPSKK